MNFKEEQALRKAELKKLAKEIKRLKPIFKESQRRLTETLDNYNIEQYERRKGLKYNPNILSMVKDVYYKSVDDMRSINDKLYTTRSDYRCLHIIYSLYNGKTIEQIEPNHNDYHYRLDTYRISNEIKKAQSDVINYRAEREKMLILKQAVI